MTTAAQDRSMLSLDSDGAVHLVGAAEAATLEGVEEALADQPSGRAGVRLGPGTSLAPLLASDGAIGRLVAETLLRSVRPVRAILFDKNPVANWALGWHQDRTIAVHERREVPGYGTWTTKAGMQHVEPPLELLAGMVTLRLHLDAVDADNAPLLVAPGSHRLGRIPEEQIAATVERLGIATCLAERGDVWVYSTLVLHASEAAARPRRRRVLQVDYSPAELPHGLEWLGV